ncbi:hypothetical protein KUCAC02_005423 [Chaenocephalus aceratus]|uniref:Uncharacterized protein n=1 Tax=Chaenocephalus aceratus TaxID=36190 RepID=A0ACB9WPC6_CHAAC|nr:hypothetical protein KUCAC02_005423 [Chaenocephalus aceratus]
MGCQTLKLVCTKQRLRRVRLAAASTGVFKRLILAMFLLDQTCADFYYTLIAQVRENTLVLLQLHVKASLSNTSE